MNNEYVCFWKPNNLNGIFSNWYPVSFLFEGHIFDSSEQAFMYKKAKLFGDETAAEKLLNCTDPRQCRAIGRIVKNFNQEVFDKYKFDFMVEVNRAKFLQNPGLAQRLASTGTITIIEASPYDFIWGAGKDENQLKQDDYAFQGQNLLGKALMKVRELL